MSSNSSYACYISQINTNVRGGLGLDPRQEGELGGVGGAPIITHEPARVGTLSYDMVPNQNQSQCQTFIQ